MILSFAAVIWDVSQCSSQITAVKETKKTHTSTKNNPLIRVSYPSVNKKKEKLHATYNQ